MISVNNSTVTFSNAGLFDSETEWLHPVIAVETYELIFVAEGTVCLYEGHTRYNLKKGDMLLLSPSVVHGGAQVSHGHTSFFWLHFYCDDSKLLPPKLFSPPAVVAERAFKEILHYQHSATPLAEIAFLKFLFELKQKPELRNKTAYEVEEFVRINSFRPLTVEYIARRFGYSADHISRLIRRELGYDAKALIIKKRLEYIENQLLNTNFSIKDISSICGFSDENAFVKFYKYHTKSTPSQFRNRYFHLHMNTERPIV